MGELLPVKFLFSMFSNGYGLLLSGAWNTLACLMLLIFLHICGSFETDFLCLLPLAPGTSLSWWVNFPLFILTGVHRGWIYCTSSNRLRKMSCRSAEPKPQYREKALGRSSCRKIKSADRYCEVMGWVVQLWAGHWNEWKWKYSFCFLLQMVVTHELQHKLQVYLQVTSPKNIWTMHWGRDLPPIYSWRLTCLWAVLFQGMTPWILSPGYQLIRLWPTSEEQRFQKVSVWAFL